STRSWYSTPARALSTTAPSSTRFSLSRMRIRIFSSNPYLSLLESRVIRTIPSRVMLLVLLARVIHGLTPATAFRRLHPSSFRLPHRFPPTNHLRMLHFVLVLVIRLRA